MEQRSNSSQVLISEAPLERTFMLTFNSEYKRPAKLLSRNMERSCFKKETWNGPAIKTTLTRLPPGPQMSLDGIRSLLLLENWSVWSSLFHHLKEVREQNWNGKWDEKKRLSAQRRLGKLLSLLEPCLKISYFWASCLYLNCGATLLSYWHMPFILRQS